MANVKKGGLADLRVGRQDMHKLDPRTIVVEPDLNSRKIDLTDPQQRTELDELKASIEVFGLLEPVGVRYDPGTDAAILVFGHRRLLAITELVAEGKIEPVIPAIGLIARDEQRRKAISIASDIHVRLNDVELGEGFQALLDMGMTVEKIADVMRSYPIAKIRACLDLADSPRAVKEAVASGAASPALARRTVREHGDSAPDVLQKKIVEAQAAGKKTATRTKAAALPKPDRLDAVGEAAQRVFDALVWRNECEATISREDAYALGVALYSAKDSRVAAIAPGEVAA